MTEVQGEETETEIKNELPSPSPPFFETLLKLRNAAVLLSGLLLYSYCLYVFNPENMELTRISEHALMPGLVTNRFDRSGLITQIYRRLEGAKTRQQDVICEHFKSWDLSCYEQKWRTNIAVERISGSNVYAWVRGHRNDGTEAQMVVVQLGTSDERLMMIAHAMAFANHAKDQVYWARDILFVFVDGADSTEQSALALDAFLQKYYMADMMVDEKYRNWSFPLIADPIKEQCGVLIAGVVYEISKIKNRRNKIVTAQLNGINGQQVNLDLFNAITKIAYTKHAAEMSVYGSLERNYRGFPLIIPSRAMYTQAFVAIEGVHSVMGKYGLQGLTVGLSPEMRGSEPAWFIESVCRMLNNALEKLHQSYFMYVLGDQMHFVSIAYYMPVIAIIIAPLLISAYYEWRMMKEFRVPRLFLYAHFSGLLYYLVTIWLYKNFGMQFRFRSGTFPPVGRPNEPDAFGYTFDLDFVFFIVTSLPVGFGGFRRTLSLNAASLRMLCQLESALVIGCISLVNFGLAAFVGVIVVPIIMVISFEPVPMMRAVIRALVALILNPLTIYAYFAFFAPPLFDYQPIAQGVFDADSGRIMFIRIIRDHVLFGSNHFPLWTIFGFAIWNMLMACAIDAPRTLVMAQEEEEDESKEKKE